MISSQKDYTNFSRKRCIIMQKCENQRVSSSRQTTTSQITCSLLTRYLSYVEKNRKFQIQLVLLIYLYMSFYILHIFAISELNIQLLIIFTPAKNRKQVQFFGIPEDGTKVQKFYISMQIAKYLKNINRFQIFISLQIEESH